MISISDLIVAQAFQSKLATGNCTQITLRYNANDIYYHLEDISCTDIAFINIFNETSIEIDAEKRFEIPDDRDSYWLIPFDGGTPYQLQRGIAWCVDCRCYGQGSCVFSWAGPLHCEGCDACALYMTPCDGGVSFRNGGVLVKASTIFEE